MTILLVAVAVVLDVWLYRRSPLRGMPHPVMVAVLRICFNNRLTVVSVSRDAIRMKDRDASRFADYFVRHHSRPRS